MATFLRGGRYIVNWLASFLSTLQVSAGLGPGHHSALEIAHPGVTHACQFFGSSIPHGPHHAVNDYLGILILYSNMFNNSSANSMPKSNLKTVMVMSS